MKSNEQYIDRLFAVAGCDLDGVDKEEVKVITSGEHYVDAGIYVVAGDADVKIPNTSGQRVVVLVSENGKLSTNGIGGHPCVDVEDNGFAGVRFGGSVYASGNARVLAHWDVFLYTFDNASSKSIGARVKMHGNSTGEIFDCHEADICDNATAHINGVGHIRCRDNSKSYVTDCTWVDAFDDSELVASGASKVNAWRRAKVEARDSTTVYLYHEAECEPSEVGNVAVIKRKGNPWDYDRR